MLLGDVEDDERDHSNWEQNGHTNSIHHSCKGDLEDIRVFVMESILWSSIKIDISLSCDLLRDFRVKSEACI